MGLDSRDHHTVVQPAGKAPQYKEMVLHTPPCLVISWDNSLKNFSLKDWGMSLIIGYL